MPLAVEDILNQALVEVGFARPIGDLFEGSQAAIIGLEIYAQTRDEILRHDDWPFARRTAPLSLNPTVPPAPWLFSYAYPGDMVFLRYVRPTPTAGDDPWAPSPVRWAIASDPPTAPAKSILSSVQGALAVYTARVTDPSQWEPLFLASLIKALAGKYLPRLGQIPQITPGAPEYEKLKAQEAGTLIEVAGKRQG